jgi:hypothetical protein
LAAIKCAYSCSTFAAARLRDTCKARSSARPARLGTRLQANLKNGFRKWNRVEPDLTDNMVIAILSDVMCEWDEQGSASESCRGRQTRVYAMMERRLDGSANHSASSEAMPPAVDDAGSAKISPGAFEPAGRSDD